MKFIITEVDTDALHNVSITVDYKTDEDVLVSTRVFYFDLDSTPHETANEFKNAVQTVIEANVPEIPDNTKRDIALQAKTLLDTFVGQEITI
jgi:hypothetical protein